MTKDTRSTLIGIVLACIIQGLTYIEAGIDISSPLWWAGLVGSWVSVIKGYYHNKPEPPTVTEEGPMIHPKPPEA